jgi:hypothetical protein
MAVGSGESASVPAVGSVEPEEPPAWDGLAFLEESGQSGRHSSPQTSDHFDLLALGTPLLLRLYRTAGKRSTRRRGRLIGIWRAKDLQLQLEERRPGRSTLSCSSPPQTSVVIERTIERSERPSTKITQFSTTKAQICPADQAICRDAPCRGRRYTKTLVAWPRLPVETLLRSGHPALISGPGRRAMEVSQRSFDR